MYDKKIISLNFYLNCMYDVYIKAYNIKIIIWRKNNEFEIKIKKIC